MNDNRFFQEMFFNIWQGNDLSQFDRYYAKDFQETITVSDEENRPLDLRMNYRELLEQAKWQKENATDTTLEIKKLVVSDDYVSVHFYSTSIVKSTGELRHRSVCGIWHLNQNGQIDRVWAVVTPYYS